MNTNLTFHRSGRGPAGRRAGRVPSLPIPAIHPPMPASDIRRGTLRGTVSVRSTQIPS